MVYIISRSIVDEFLPSPLVACPLFQGDLSIVPDLRQNAIATVTTHGSMHVKERHHPGMRRVRRADRAPAVLFALSPVRHSSDGSLDDPACPQITGLIRQQHDAVGVEPLRL